MKTVFVCLFALAAVVAAQEIKIIRLVQEPQQSAGFRPLQLIPSLFGNLPTPAQQTDDFPDFLKAMFSLDNPFADMQAQAEQEEKQAEEEAQQVAAGFMNHMLGKMQSLMGSLLNNEDQQEEEPLVLRVRVRVCPFVAACGDDVDQFCARARLSEVQGAVKKCLRDNLDDISAQCRDLLNSDHAEHNHSENQDDQDEQDQDSDEQQLEDEPVPHAHVIDQRPMDEPQLPETPIPKPQSPVKHTSFSGCVADSESFCSGESSLVNVMSCLLKNEKKLSPACTKAVSKMPIFNCADDVRSLCPNSVSRSQITSCLREKSGLSERCIKSVRLFRRENIPRTHNGHRVLTKAQASAKHAHDTQQPTNDEHAQKKRKMMVVAGVSFGVFVALMAVVALVQRRRRTYTEVEDQEATIQLAPPVVNLAAPAFQPSEDTEL